MTNLVARLDAPPPKPAALRKKVSKVTVGVQDLEISADIGVYPHEIGKPQPLRVAVTLDLEPIVPEQLDQSVDYNSIVAAATSLGRERIDLIETFAARLAQLCLNDPRVRSADVRIDKPQALASGTATSRVVLQRCLA